MNKLKLSSIVLLGGIMILVACSNDEGKTPVENYKQTASSFAPSHSVSPDTNQTELQLENIDADLQNNGEQNRLELYAKVGQYGNPLSWHLKVDSVEKVMLSLAEEGIYGAPADLKIEDIDGDKKPEVLIYRYSQGSGGAVGLTIYKPSEEWRKIFTIENPFEFDHNHALGRFEVKYLGDMKVSFIDQQTGLEATIPLDKKKYQDIEIKISTWVDAISEYEFKDKDKDGIKEINAIQRIVGSSHADTIGLLITTHQVENGEYHGKAIAVHDEQGNLIQEVEFSIINES
jgi:hypothetical protein